MTRPRRPAFTLVEVLIAMAVSSVVIVGAYQLMSFGARTTGRASDRSDAVDAVGSAVVQLADRLRWCQDIVTPGVGGEADELEFGGVRTGAWRASVVDGDLVLREVHGSQKKVLAQGIDAIRFKRTGVEDDCVVIEMGVGEGPGARSYRTVIYARGTRRPTFR